MNFLDSRLPDRFWSKVSPCPMSGCWIWTGAATSCGYGILDTHAGSRLVHRHAFVATHGAVPEGLEVDHVCRVRACCNPAHLRAVTHRANTLFGKTIAAANANKSSCPRGHSYEGNLYYDDTKNKRGRRCRACKLEQQRNARRSA